MPKARAHILSLILKQLKSRATFDAEGIARYRTLMSSSNRLFRLPKDVCITRFSIGSIQAAWLVPGHGDVSRCIMYTHGGGYIAGSIDSHTNLAARLSKAADAGVLLFNYRLAPENKFPAGLNDTHTIYKWLLNRVGDSSAIALVGDSAGGGLNLAMLSNLLKQKIPLPGCSVFFSPWIDLRCSSKSHEQLAGKDPMLAPDDLKTVARLYTEKPLETPEISPVLNDFSGLSPVLVQVGENEILLDDAKMLDQKLKNANVTSELDIWAQMFHVWHLFSRFIPEGVQAITAAGQFIQTHTRTLSVSVNGLPDVPEHLDDVHRLQ